MARLFGAQPEIARRLHQSGAEVMLPDAVYHDARSERIVRAGNGAGEFESSAALPERLALWAGDYFDELARYFLAQARSPAAIEHARVRLRSTISKDQCRGRPERDEAAIHIALQLP